MEIVAGYLNQKAMADMGWEYEERKDETGNLDEFRENHGDRMARDEYMGNIGIHWGSALSVL